MQSKNNRVQVYSDIKEFIYVAELMISNESQSHLKALSYLKIWCERKSENKIARSIYITYCLLNAYFVEKSQMALSFAMSKFISSECKEEEDKNNFNHKLPIYSTAKNIKLPAYMIQLRHDIIHSNDLVPIDVLNEAYHDAIDWLRDEFWIPQIEQIQMIYFSHDKISDILNEYLDLAGNDETFTKDNIFFRKCNDIFNGISINEFFNVLLTENYLFKIDTHEDCAQSSFSLRLRLWMPMLEFLNDARQIDTLVECSFDLLNSFDNNVPIQTTIRDWCLFLLKSCPAKRKSKNNQLNLSISSENVKNVNWPGLVVKFLKRCLCKDDVPILRELLTVHQPPIAGDKRVQIVHIVESFCRNESIAGESAEIYTHVLQELARSSYCFSPFGM